MSEKQTRKPRPFPYGGLVRLGARQRALIGAVVLFAAVWAGCSDTASPPAENDLGTINMRLMLDLPAQEAVSADGTRPAGSLQPVIDSLAVGVFRRGAGATLEVKKGVRVTGATSQIDVSVNCIAENYKKVSVELFEAGVMMYFGVDEDVNVRTNENTDVVIEAADIRVGDFTVSPTIAGSGDTVTLHWSSIPAAVIFGVQESRTESFDTVIWETLTTDTLLLLTRGLGSHFFRVTPINAYAGGSPSRAAFCYVTDGTEPSPSISGIDPVEAAPGQLVTISGVNLDLPGTQLLVGDKPCPIISASDDRMVIQIARNAQTGYLYLWSILGTHMSQELLTVQRVAFVTGSNGSGGVNPYVALITADPAIIGYSGVEVITVDDLDGRDLSVFDLIIVAGDTGNLTGNWGGDYRRAQHIADSGAQILAMGSGGAEYLQLVSAAMAGLSATVTQQQEFYVPDGALPIFSLPFSIVPSGPSTMPVCDYPEDVVSFYVEPGAKPLTVSLFASLVGNPDYYPVVDHEDGAGIHAVRSFFWGYDGDPANTTPLADGCLLNIVNLLITSVAAEPAVDSR